MKQVWVGVCALLVLSLPIAIPGVRAQAANGPRYATARSPADLRTWDAVVDRMDRSGDLRLRQRRRDPLLASRLHERFDQYFAGVRVFGGDVARQSQGGLTTSVFGAVYEGITLNPSPSRSAPEAREIIARLSGLELPDAYSPELVILPGDGGGHALAYRGRVFGPQGLFVYFVDAHSGELLLAYDDLQAQSAIGRGPGVLGDTKKVSVHRITGGYRTEDELRPPSLVTLDLKSDLTRTRAILNGTTALLAADVASDSDNAWTDPAIVDAHAYSGWVYDFLFKRFGRRGLDDANVPVTSIVHPVDRQAALEQSSATIGMFYVNAFYAGDGLMVFGEGLPPNLVDSLGRRWNYTSGALDVFAHELAHGVTDYSSRLIYRNESGALNEAFSDIIGVSAEFYFQPRGAGLQRADYLIAEDVVTPGGLRSLENPATFGDPDHYSRRYTGTNDNGGVHTNATIAGHAFYLAIEGGVNRTSGLTVTGVGGGNRERMEKVFYRAFTQMMPSNATFAVARAATIQAARDLYGADSAAARTVAEAWTAVGVD